MPATLEQPMARQQTMPVRLSVAAIEAAKQAAGIKKKRLTDYCSEVILEHASRDIDEFVASRTKESQKPPRKPEK